MKILISFIVFIIFVNSFQLYAQTTCNVTCANTFNGAGNSDDRGYGIVADGSNNYYVSGHSVVNPADSADIVLIKYNSNCQQVWVRTYDGPAHRNDAAICSAMDIYGNIYVAGFSQGTGTGPDLMLLKYSPDGDTLWTRRYHHSAGGDVNDKIFSIKIDGENNAVLIGYITYTNNSNRHMILLKYTPSGSLSPGFPIIHDSSNTQREFVYYSSLDVDNSNNIYVSFGRDIGGSYFNCVTLKYGPGGGQNPLYAPIEYNLGATQEGNASAVKVDLAGNIYVGLTRRATNYDFLTLRYTQPNLNPVWTNIYDVSGDAFSSDLGIDDSGYVYSSGYGEWYNPYGYDVVTRKINPQTGSTIWTNEYNSAPNKNDLANRMVLTADKIYIACSFQNSGGYDFGVLALNYNGSVYCTYRHPQLSQAHAINICKNDNLIYATGMENLAPGNSNIYTVRIGNVTGINNTGTETPKDYQLYQNYPNPFNPSTRIRFEIPSIETISEVHLRVYDILGREVTTLVSEVLKPGTYDVEWDASNYPSGVYYYRIEAENFTETKKMLLMK